MKVPVKSVTPEALPKSPFSLTAGGRLTVFATTGTMASKLFLVPFPRDLLLVYFICKQNLSRRLDFLFLSAKVIKGAMVALTHRYMFVISNMAWYGMTFV